MLFPSVTFLFYFLPFVLLGYFLLPTIRARNVFLLLASLLFYFWGEPWFVLLMVVSIGVNYISGLLLEKVEEKQRATVLRIAIELNLILLLTFKYSDFLLENLNTFIQPLGWYVPLFGFTLPLGISFFTFQAISYLIDVYRRRTPAEKNPLDLGLYISMFPQLVAGPIVRFEKIANQIHERRSTLGRASVGTRIFIIGLAQKVLVADGVARMADIAFATDAPGALEAWFGLIAYTVQIYFDFAGYSNMAIGLGLVFGFTFPRNFRLPYRSKSVSEFWRRWHISLSSWFRDYLYVPLGGNRRTPARAYLNLVVVFLLCGLWHGASWTFVVWGVHHGMLLIIERAWLGRRLLAVPSWVSRAYTLFTVMAGWVWFRASDLDHACRYFMSLAGANGASWLAIDTYLRRDPTTLAALTIGIFLALRSGRIFPRRNIISTALQRWQVSPIAVIDSFTVGILLFFSVLAVGTGAYHPFLYFRF